MVVFFAEVIGGLPETNFKLDHSCVNLWQWDVDTLLKTTSDGWVEFPGYVRRAQHEDSIIIIAHALHLHEEFGLNAARCFILTLASASTKGIDLIDKDNGGFIFSCKLEKLFH
jgi:hypothetical protein